MNEFYNQGFIKYFFWNENIARYLFKNYGDMYGSGHRQPYGFAWIFLAAEFLPWTVVLVPICFMNSLKLSKKYIFSGDAEKNFVFYWLISTPLFLTFVRQMHGMYLLPAAPPLSIFLAENIVSNQNIQETLKKISYSNKLIWTIVGVFLISIAIGTVLRFKLVALLLGVAISAITLYIIMKIREDKRRLLTRGLSILSAGCVGIYLLSIVVFSPYINETRSTKEAIRKIIEDSKHENNVPQIGVSTTNTFSYYWLAKAWKNKLSKKIEIK